MPHEQLNVRRHLSTWGPIAMDEQAYDTFVTHQEGAREAGAYVQPFGPYVVIEGAGDVTAEVLMGYATAEHRAAARAHPRGRTGRTVVIPIHGVITPFGASPLMRMFGISSASLPEIVGAAQAAAADETVSRIILAVHSPGGSAFGVREAAAALREVASRKTMIAHVNFLAASAGYWLASSAQEIVASPSGIVGSVGVAIAHVDFSEADKRAGITVTHIAKPESKRDVTSDKPLSESGRKELTRLVETEYDAFAADISRARGVDMRDVGEEYGRIVPTRDALRLRMIDRTATFGELLNEARPSDDLTQTRRARLAILERTTNAQER